MTSIHFAQARQGRGPRLPRAGRAAVCGCVIGVGLSQFFYPRVRVDLCRTAEIETSRDRVLSIDDAPIRVKGVYGERGKDADARMIWALRFLMAVAKGGAQ